MSIEIGIDTGGSFTDVVCHVPGIVDRVLKVPSTPEDPSRAVLAALHHLRSGWAIDLGGIARFVHGTTVATNAVLERKGARVGLITTEGFRDVLEIGRQLRTAIYDLELEPETPVFLAPVPGDTRSESGSVPPARFWCPWPRPRWPRRWPRWWPRASSSRSCAR